MNEWQTGPHPFGRGFAHSKPLTIMVDPGGGTVEVQFQDSAGNWQTPQDYLFDTFGPHRLDMTSVFGGQIIATGAAKFKVIRE